MSGVRIAAVALAALLTLGQAGCGGDRETAGPGPSGGARAVTGPITVFAAASLTESFTTIGERFEAAHPGTTVTFSFGGSSALATQINEGAPADVLASAAPATMQAVSSAVAPTTFVRNRLVIAVAEGNPRGVAGLADLGRPGLKVAVCAEAMPCGAAARKAIEDSGASFTPVTLEQDVRAALSKLTLGEVDAALIYRTDALAAAADVDAVEFPESVRAVNDYPIAVLADARNLAGARAFVDHVLSAEGAAVLTAAGFQAP